MNRQIYWEVLNREGQGDYNLGPIAKRECVLMFNTKTMRGAGLVEYTI